MIKLKRSDKGIIANVPTCGNVQIDYVKKVPNYDLLIFVELKTTTRDESYLEGGLCNLDLGSFRPNIGFMRVY